MDIEVKHRTGPDMYAGVRVSGEALILGYMSPDLRNALWQCAQHGRQVVVAASTVAGRCHRLIWAATSVATLEEEIVTVGDTAYPVYTLTLPIVEVAPPLVSDPNAVTAIRHKLIPTGVKWIGQMPNSSHYVEAALRYCVKNLVEHGQWFDEDAWKVVNDELSTLESPDPEKTLKGIIDQNVAGRRAHLVKLATLPMTHVATDVKQTESPRMPQDYVKIDKTFLAGPGTSAQPGYRIALASPSWWASIASWRTMTDGCAMTASITLSPHCIVTLINDDGEMGIFYDRQMKTVTLNIPRMPAAVMRELDGIWVTIQPAPRFDGVRQPPLAPIEMAYAEDRMDEMVSLLAKGVCSDGIEIREMISILIEQQHQKTNATTTQSEEVKLCSDTPTTPPETIREYVRVSKRLVRDPGEPVQPMYCLAEASHQWWASVINWYGSAGTSRVRAAIDLSKHCSIVFDNSDAKLEINYDRQQQHVTLTVPRPTPEMIGELKNEWLPIQPWAWIDDQPAGTLTPEEMVIAEKHMDYMVLLLAKGHCSDGRGIQTALTQLIDQRSWKTNPLNTQSTEMNHLPESLIKQEEKTPSQDAAFEILVMAIPPVKGSLDNVHRIGIQIKQQSEKLRTGSPVSFVSSNGFAITSGVGPAMSYSESPHVLSALFIRGSAKEKDHDTVFLDFPDLNSLKTFHRQLFHALNEWKHIGFIFKDMREDNYQPMSITHWK